MLLKSHFLPVVICIFVLQTMQNFKKLCLKMFGSCLFCGFKKVFPFPTRFTDTDPCHFIWIRIWIFNMILILIPSPKLVQRFLSFKRQNYKCFVKIKFTFFPYICRHIDPPSWFQLNIALYMFIFDLNLFSPQISCRSKKATSQQNV